MTTDLGSEPNPSPSNSPTSALSHITVCDFGGQVAGAVGTRWLAAFGATVIRIEDPATRGSWDILRPSPGAFNNFNVGKLGITVNLRTDRGRDLIRRIVARSDVVSENFAAGVLARRGFSYDELRAIRSDIVYVSFCGFGQTGPHAAFKTWGPIVQAMGGLTFSSGLPDLPPAGWGYSYMDHHGGYFMAIAILAALAHRNRTGEGAWIDMAGVETGAAMMGPVALDFAVNGRPLRRPGMPHSNRNQHPRMVPHGIYPAAGDDNWIAIACRDDADWEGLGRVVDQPWTKDPRFGSIESRVAEEDAIDDELRRWTADREARTTADDLVAAGVPASIVARPADRIDGDANTAEWHLWPTVTHAEIGDVRVDGMPVHFSSTDWTMDRAAPQLGADNDRFFTQVLGLSPAEVASLREEGVI